MAVFGFSNANFDQVSYKSALLDLSASIEKAFASRDVYTGLKFDVASEDLGIVPIRLADGVGPDGSEVDIAPIMLNGIADSGYQISLEFTDAESAYSWCVQLLENNRAYWRETGPGGDIREDHSIATLTASCDGETKLLLRR